MSKVPVIDCWFRLSIVTSLTVHFTFTAAFVLSLSQAFADYADSSNIRVDTRGRNLVSLNIVPADQSAPIPMAKGSQPAPASSNTVPSGGVKQFLAWALYDDNTTEDVTAQANWIPGAGLPKLTSLVGGLLNVGTTGTPIAGQVSAAFTAGIRSAKGICNFTVLPGPQIEVSSVVALAPSGFQISATAQVVGNQQAVNDNEILWDLDNDENYGESGEIGSLVTKKVSVKKNYLLRVRAMADGQTVSRSFIVEVNGAPPPGAPETLAVQDITVDGLKVWNGSSLANGGLYTGRTGLAVVIHGLEDSTVSSWVSNLCGAIQGTVSNANVAAWDWRLMADPSLYATSTTFPNDVKGLATLIAGGDLFLDLLTIRENGQTNGVLLAERLLAEYSAGRLSKSTPIHLIGHSAGGFAAGECAKRLKSVGFTNLQVTMLDTPIPFKSHVSSGWRTERYIAGFFGGRFESEPTQLTVNAKLYNLGASFKGSKIETIDYDDDLSFLNVRSPISLSGYTIRPASGISGGANYQRVEIQHPSLPTGATNRHSYAHDWYIASVNSSMPGGEGGFAYSNLLGSPQFSQSMDVIQAPMMAADALQTMAEPPAPVSVDTFTYFGTASGAGGVHTLTENTDAGMWKNFTLPIGSQTLRIRYQFTTPGDGDFLAAYWGEEAVLVICPDTNSSRAGFVEMEADVSRFGGQQWNLVFKLVSRGEVNAVAQIDQIQIELSDDPDDDGLTNDQEATNGSNPHREDSDGDGLSDYDEVTTHGTNAALADTDGDMVPDAAELAAGTDPMDKNLFLRPRMERGAGGQPELLWQGVSGRTYSVVRSLDLQGTAFDYIRTEVPGTGVDCIVVDTDMAVNPRAFYWVIPE